MLNKKGEFGFVWIFAIFAGIAILLFMIYGASRVIDTDRNLANTQLAKSLSIIFDPFEAGPAETVSGYVEFSKDTKLLVNCMDVEYGDNRIQVATKINSRANEWDTGEEIIVKDKYVFTDAEQEGKRFNVFSQGFEYPYKISDLIFISSRDYCFLDAPTRLRSKYSAIDSIVFDNCTGSGEEVTVCFGHLGCNITVEGLCSGLLCETDFDYGFVRRDGVTIPYSDSLLLAAIVADNQNYVCNVKRLMYRASKIAELLSRKSELATSRGCYSNLNSYLEVLEATFLHYTPYNFISDTETILQIKSLNKQEACGLW